MSTAFDPTARSRGELRFHLFGVPIRVLPWFWLTSAILSGSQDGESVLIWVAVCFVSILAHELGHVFAFRAYGTPAEAVLYSFGGLAVPRFRHRGGTLGEIVIAVAGPAAGFCLAAAVVAAALSAGARVSAGFYGYVIPFVSATILPPELNPSNYSQYLYLNRILSDLLYVNIYWGLVNLLPIYPLDGGRVSRALLAHRDAVRGQRHALYLSIAAAAAVAAPSIATGDYFLVLLFGMLAFSNVQSLRALPHRP